MESANVFAYNIAYPFAGINDIEKITNEGKLYDNRFIEFAKQTDKIDLLTNAEQILFPTKRIDKVEKLKADIERKKQIRNDEEAAKKKATRLNKRPFVIDEFGKPLNPCVKPAPLTKNDPTIIFIKEKLTNARNDIDKNKLMLLALKEITDDIIKEGTDYIKLSDSVLEKHEKLLSYSVNANVKTAQFIKNQDLLNSEMRFIIDEQQQRIQELENKLKEQENINKLNNLKISKIIDILENIALN